MYYKRYQVPRGDNLSHSGLDQQKVGIARWFGPARVLATETRSETSPPVKRPASVVWIVASGKLKRCSPTQLRHCSEKERLIAEASQAVVTPWSFSSLLHLVERGQFQRYDDLELDEDQPSFRERELRSSSQPAPSSVRGRSRSRAPKDAQNKGKDPKRKEQGPQEGQQREEGKRPPKDQTEKREREKTTRTEDVEPARTVQRTVTGSSAPRHGGELQTHPPYLAAQRRSSEGVMNQTLHELLHGDKSYIVEDGDPMSCVYTITMDLPDNKRDLKEFVKDGTKWVSRKLKKGAELKWKDIPKDRLADFEKAKLKELNSWIKEKAVKLVTKEVDKSRVMRMRWIYTLKQDDTAKARIVIIGFEDPDLTTLQTASPTMSRRTRGLFLSASSAKGWTILKGDVKAAFLQGLESETSREVFAKPVRELSNLLGGDENSVVQIAKACYGLANAPAQWYTSVSSTMVTAGCEVLRTEPCCWRLMDRSDPEHPRLIGLACAHVDDFLFAGESDHPLYQRAVSHLYDAYQWSPWEIEAFSHCGVKLVQHPDGSVNLNHADYCAEIEPINITGRSDKDRVTSSELQELRAVLGALQWRVYQTGPQHGARLSMLQSQLADPTVATLCEANKLVREVYQGRHLGLKYQRLEVENLEEVVFVAWTDAAVGNRRDYSSSGGYFIAACEPKILEGKPSKINPVSWKSGRLPRVARSSLSAEIQAFSIAEEELMYIRMQWLELCGKDIPDHDPFSLLHHARATLVTDAKSLYDVVKKGPQNTSGYGLKEKYSILDMMSLFQRLSKGKTETRWVHSDAQIADSLTKPVANSSLLRVLIVKGIGP